MEKLLTRDLEQAQVGGDRRGLMLNLSGFMEAGQPKMGSLVENMISCTQIGYEYFVSLGFLDEVMVKICCSEEVLLRQIVLAQLFAGTTSLSSYFCKIAL